MKKTMLRIGVLIIMFSTFMSIMPETTVKSEVLEDGFKFFGIMSEQVLHNYLNRAVTFQGLCGEGSDSNMLIKEDIRFLIRTGTKFVSRAALFAWTSTQPEHVEFHFLESKKLAAAVHLSDPQIILQAFVAEIVRKSYVDKIKIPEWVFEAFEMDSENRNFNFNDIINKEKGPNYWGNEAGYPDYSNLEARMWYYYCIRRYIDAGFESIHIQEGEDVSEYVYVDEILQMSRKYASMHARRGLVLFHNFFSMFNGGNKIGDRLLFDIHGNGIVPIETINENGAMKCKIGDYREPGNALQWLGRSAGGIHPLGFYVDSCPALLEFDNYGPDPKGEPGVSNGVEFYTWGYDDITWFAMQPDWYREEFLRYVTEYLKTNCLDSKGSQVYYCIYPARRVITPVNTLPERKYLPGDLYSTDFLFDYCDSGREDVKIKFNVDNSFTLQSKKFYRANRSSDGCPNGFSDEDVIMNIFLGKNIPDNNLLSQSVLPDGYTPDKHENSSSESSVTPKITPVESSIFISKESKVSTSDSFEVSDQTTSIEESSLLSESKPIEINEESSDQSDSLNSEEEAIGSNSNAIRTMILLISITLLFITGGVAYIIWQKKRKNYKSNK